MPDNTVGFVYPPYHSRATLDIQHFPSVLLVALDLTCYNGCQHMENYLLNNTSCIKESSVYQETIDSLKSLQTPTTHIKKLGVILTKTEDSKLYSLIQNTLTFLQQRHANPRIKGKSTPGDLYNNPFAPIKALIQYCEQFTKKNKPEWQVLAERNGWTPPPAA